MSGDLLESKGGHMPGGSGEDLESVREDGQTVFLDAVLISADTLPQRTEQGRYFWVASGRIAAWFRDPLNIFVGLWLSEKDAASVDSCCVF